MKKITVYMIAILLIAGSTAIFADSGRGGKEGKNRHREGLKIGGVSYKHKSYKKHNSYKHKNHRAAKRHNNYWNTAHRKSFNSRYRGTNYYGNNHNRYYHHNNSGLYLGSALGISIRNNYRYSSAYPNGYSNGYYDRHFHNGVACSQNHSYRSSNSRSSEVVGCHRIETLSNGDKHRVELPLDYCL